MIQRIELWDFESHEHTVLDCISPALNLICGESNSGKTSIIRALKLAAYNQFDPRSVRVGATKCVVLVETERGSVKVTRGPKHNAWETTRKGMPTQYFDKVGTNIVPDAVYIIGLNIITLGDVQVPVNIMDQLESHFMLAGVGNKDATGSMRAQIVDEISGLSGIEGLIKDVSLDHHRCGREIKETEKTMEEARVQLHSETELQAESDILSRAEKEVADYDELVKVSTTGNELLTVWNNSCLKAQELERRIAEIPDTKTALSELSQASDMRNFAETAMTLFDCATKVADRLTEIQAKIVKMPDSKDALRYVDVAERETEKVNGALELLGAWSKIRQDMELNRDRKAVLVAAKEGIEEIETAERVMGRCLAAADLLDGVLRLTGIMTKTKSRVVEIERNLKKAMKDRDDLLAMVKTCPLTLKPISKECRE